MGKRNPDLSETVFKMSSETPEAPQQSSDPAPRSVPPDSEEQDFFPSESGRRLFGEGSYGEGGSNEEGNFEARDANPHGGLGSFTDAGGYGATELLGEHKLPASSAADIQKVEERENKQ